MAKHWPDEQKSHRRQVFWLQPCAVGYNVLLNVAPETIKRCQGDQKALLRQARGWLMRRTIEVQNPRLRGWINYFRHIGAKGILEELDGCAAICAKWQGCLVEFWR